MSATLPAAERVWRVDRHLAEADRFTDWDTERPELQGIGGLRPRACDDMSLVQNHPAYTDYPPNVRRSAIVLWGDGGPHKINAGGSTIAPRLRETLKKKNRAGEEYFSGQTSVYVSTARRGAVTRPHGHGDRTILAMEFGSGADHNLHHHLDQSGALHYLDTKSVPHYRPCGDVECVLHKSDQDLNYNVSGVQDIIECKHGIGEVLIPIFVLDGAEISKTLGRGKYEESIIKDPRGHMVTAGKHKAVTWIGGECPLHNPRIEPEGLRRVEQPEVSKISVTPADFPGLSHRRFVRDIRQIYPCTDHASTYPFGDIMSLIQFVYPQFWASAAAEDLLPMQSKQQKTEADKKKAAAAAPAAATPPPKGGRRAAAPPEAPQEPKPIFISYHFKAVRDFMFSPVGPAGDTRFDGFVDGLPDGAGGAQYAMRLLRKLVALHMSPPEVLVVTWGLADLEAQCAELKSLGEKFAFNYFKIAPQGTKVGWKSFSHWYTGHMHDYHRILPTSVGRTEGDEWQHHWLETMMVDNRKMEIAAGVSLLGRALTDLEAGNQWRREKGIEHKDRGVKLFTRVK
eukprot:gene4374-4638_t